MLDAQTSLWTFAHIAVITPFRDLWVRSGAASTLIAVPRLPSDRGTARSMGQRYAAHPVSLSLATVAGVGFASLLHTSVTVIAWRGMNTRSRPSLREGCS